MSHEIRPRWAAAGETDRQTKVSRLSSNPIRSRYQVRRNTENPAVFISLHSCTASRQPQSERELVLRATMRGSRTSFRTWEPCRRHAGSSAVWCVCGVTFSRDISLGADDVANELRLGSALPIIRKCRVGPPRRPPVHFGSTQRHSGLVARECCCPVPS